MSGFLSLPPLFSLHLPPLPPPLFPLLLLLCPFPGCSLWYFVRAAPGSRCGQERRSPRAQLGEQACAVMTLAVPADPSLGSSNTAELIFLGTSSSCCSLESAERGCKEQSSSAQPKGPCSEVPPCSCGWVPQHGLPESSLSATNHPQPLCRNDFGLLGWTPQKPWRHRVQKDSWKVSGLFFCFPLLTDADVLLLFVLQTRCTCVSE